MTDVTTNPEVEADEALVLVQAQPMEKLFERVTIDPILDKIATHCRAVPRDMSSETGRKAIASLAYKIAKTKTFIETQRLSLVTAEKKRLQAIDSEGKRIRDTLDSLKDEIRKPLTDWEDAEKARVEKHEAMMLDLARTDYHGTIEVQERIDFLTDFSASSLEEFAERAQAVLHNSMIVLKLKLDQCKKDDADRAELARLRSEREAREKKEHEERIAAQAREQAEKRAKEAEERAKRAEEEKAAAVRKAKIDAEFAVTRERERAEQVRKAEAEAAAKRESSRKFRAQVHNAALDVLIKNGIPSATAKKVIELIAKGIVPRVSVSY